jgi:RND family efflux transporter MFP subunit
MNSSFNLRFTLLTLLTIGSISLVGCGRRGGEQAAPTKATQASAESAAIQVSVTPAHVESLSQTIEITGALNTLRDVTVGVKANGKLVAVYFREGDTVRAGQVVAQQDTTDLQAQLDSVIAQQNQAQANLAVAQSKLEQARVTHRNSETTLKWTDDQTRTAVRQAQAGLEAAKQTAAIVEEGARPQERQQAEESVTAAKADRDKARSDLKRYQELYRQQAIAAQQLDQAQAVADAADARYNSAVQALSLIKEGARPEDRRRAQAQVEQAQQTLATAQSNRDQVKLRKADVETARAGILSALASVQQAKASVQQAQAAVRLAQQAVKDTAVVSPIDGVVAERKAEPGVQLTTVNADVMRIVALSSIFYDAQLPETQYDQVRAGQSVTVHVDALPNRTFRGTVAKIFPVASTTARTFTVRVALQNEGNTLRPQMFARGEITLATRARALVVPRDAVLDYNLEKRTGRVFVAKEGKAEERTVKTGFSTFRLVEIIEGVRDGEKVITTGQAQLQNGDKIEAVANGAPKQVTER